jgi:Mn-dependent DtxR family transcriptional regulator
MTSGMTSGVQEDIMEVLNKDGIAAGTEQLALTINVRRKSWLREILRRLASVGSITIIPSRGGRGNKTVYKRNRNSPGQPRKVR